MNTIDSPLTSTIEITAPIAGRTYRVIGRAYPDQTAMGFDQTVIEVRTVDEDAALDGLIAYSTVHISGCLAEGGLRAWAEGFSQRIADRGPLADRAFFVTVRGVEWYPLYEPAGPAVVDWAGVHRVSPLRPYRAVVIMAGGEEAVIEWAGDVRIEPPRFITTAEGEDEVVEPARFITIREGQEVVTEVQPESFITTPDDGKRRLMRAPLVHLGRQLRYAASARGWVEKRVVAGVVTRIDVTYLD